MAKRKVSHKRKDFLPTLVVTILLWTVLGVIVYFVDPQTFGIVPIFFLLFFSALLFSFSTLFANTRRGVIAASTLVVFALLRFFGVGNALNFILLAGLAIAAELYFTKA